MDIFFNNPNEVPLPPSEVRILDLDAHPYADGTRVKVTFKLTPFQSKPNVDFVILDDTNRELSTVSIIGCMLPKMDLTIHLPQAQWGSTLHLKTIVYYSQFPDQEEERESDNDPFERQNVHSKQISFKIPDQQDK